MNLKEITTIEAWHAVLEQSTEQKVVVFKHSTTCPISAEAYREFEQYLQEADENTTHVLVKVIESRPVSNQIAAELAVKHESPQVILIDQKQATWDTSHWNITKSKLTEAVRG